MLGADRRVALPLCLIREEQTFYVAFAINPAPSTPRRSAKHRSRRRAAGAKSRNSRNRESPARVREERDKDAKESGARDGRCFSSWGRNAMGGRLVRARAPWKALGLRGTDPRPRQPAGLIVGRIVADQATRE